MILYTFIHTFNCLLLLFEIIVQTFNYNLQKCNSYSSYIYINVLIDEFLNGVTKQQCSYLESITI